MRNKQEEYNRFFWDLFKHLNTELMRSDKISKEVIKEILGRFREDCVMKFRIEMTREYRHISIQRMKLKIAELKRQKKEQKKSGSDFFSDMDEM